MYSVTDHHKEGVEDTLYETIGDHVPEYELGAKVKGKGSTKGICNG